MYFRITDTQLDEVKFTVATEEDVKEFAFDIMKSRDNDNGDELGFEFKEHVKRGVDNLGVDYALEVLGLWEYKAEVLTIATYFWTPYDTVHAFNGEAYESKKLIGKDFILITEKNRNDYDYEEVGVMLIIEFDGAVVCEAFPEEVFIEYQNIYKKALKENV